MPPPARHHRRRENVQPRCDDTAPSPLCPRWHDGLLLAGGRRPAHGQDTDKGETWKAGLHDQRRRVYGPIFGKDGKQLFVLTKAGIVESTDGGASSSKPIRSPRS